jgi:formylglycine-generating enzyme required for sulfatase activity
MILFAPPGEFLMGSPTDEAGRRVDEVLHTHRIDRRFAVASKKVTVAQFERFKKDHPEIKHRFTREYSPDDDSPIISVTWYEAAQYCRWLSEQEGIDRDQMCYPTVAEIEQAKQGKPLRLPADFLKRTGYRLPTEAEWEFVNRGGSRASRCYGSCEEMLAYHAWYIRNSENHAWPVGQKKPNAYGLFDMLGNTWDWCQSPWERQKRPRGEVVNDEGEDLIVIEDRLDRVLRGGSFTYNPKYVRAAFRLNDRPSLRYHTVGLRVARTHR